MRLAFCFPRKIGPRGAPIDPGGGCDAELTRGWLRGGMGSPSKRPVCTNDKGNSGANTTRVPRRYTVILGGLAFAGALLEAESEGRGV